MIIKTLLVSIVEYLSKFGHVGIFLAMSLESACIPLPSEVILPLAGYMVFLQKGTVLSMTIVATLGCLAGSLLAYVVGYYGGRPFVLKYGKYIFITPKDLDKADRFFKKHGEATIFFSRILPVVRTFISLPAGIARMNILKFSILTVVGSFPWCLLFIFLGKKFGENWSEIEKYFKNFDYIVAALLVVIIGIFIYTKVKENKIGKNMENNPESE